MIAARHGRWLDLVRPGADVLAYGGRNVFRRLRPRGQPRFWHFCFQSAERLSQGAALPDRASLLVEGAASGQIFVSVGPHDDGFSIRVVVSYFYPSLKGVLSFWR